MQLQITTDYAIRIVSYLYQNKNKLSTAKIMAGQLGITYKYFMKVINQLRDAGLVISVQGCNGGYQISSKANDLSIYDIICVMQGEIVINRCLEQEQFCSRRAVADCAYHKLFASAQSEIVNIFKSKKIADYIN